PPGEQDLAKQKAAAAAKAKAAALARKQAKEEGTENPPGEEDLAKQKAAAAAKAKAAALARKQAKEEGTENPSGEEGLAKQKAAAAAKAKAAALARKQKSAGSDADSEQAKAKAKAIAAAKAKAAAAAKTKATVEEMTEGATKNEPSPNQPKLNQIVSAIERHVGQDALIDHYINKLSKDVPTIVANPNTYYSIAKLLRYDEQLNFAYLSELHGTDFETHMEIYVHLHSFSMNQSVALKVKLDRAAPVIPSLVPLWTGANWPECEAYDLLGIDFREHPDLKRILLGDDWKGYPLRKDYQPYDVEV
ncbi:NADH-quinone oxidoreductase subunit C, partial [Peribacillus muralis]